VVPTQTVGSGVPAELTAVVRCAISPPLLDELWRTCDADACGLSRTEFEQILLRIGMAQNFGSATGLPVDATPQQQAAFFTGLRIADLVLARACASGNERAWERFIALYRQPLLRAGIAITSNESLGRELADGLYAELYGLTTREGERRCPLDSYSGRGSLIGWLRTTLAQRHVDRHRRTHREQPLDESGECEAPVAEAATEPDQKALPLLAAAVKEAMEQHSPEERFLLASYYLDGRRLHEIAAVLGVHEATISRKLKRATESVRKQILRSLERKGLRRREAEEALGTDPRDLTAAINDPAGADPGANPHRLRLKELLQSSEPQPFKEQAGR
jgi:RNA polymerase sigma-70 factor (ECF subfamily)